MMRVGRLLFPAIRWDARTKFEHEQPTIDTALQLGVGGFSIFGGDAQAVAELTAELRARSHDPLLIASDLERGAGQQFTGATPLPPLAAIGALDDLEITRRAAALTAREALALGVNWIYAPVADVDLEPRNPIVGSRAFGAEPEAVARQVAAWIRGCHEEGAICCAKHFPGHGRTTTDSHAVLPRVEASRDLLEQTDLKPFRAAVHAGVDAVMTAHVSFPALDPSAAPATRSQPVIANLLRRDIGFTGLIVTDALIMEGMLAGDMDESSAAVAAILAGCDVLLYPANPECVAAALDTAAAGNAVAEVRVADAIERVAAVAARTPARRDAPWGSPEDRAWAVEVGARSLLLVRGEAECPRTFDLLTIDDDTGGPFAAPSRAPFARALRDAGMKPREVEEADEDRELLVAVYSDVRAWKGPPGLSHLAAHRLSEAVQQQPSAIVVFFGHPRLAREMPGATVLAAWGGEAVMQEAAAHWLAAVV